jgi:hypothetical protein
LCQTGLEALDRFRSGDAVVGGDDDPPYELFYEHLADYIAASTRPRA